MPDSANRRPGYHRALQRFAWVVGALFCLALYRRALGAWFLDDDFAWLHLPLQVANYALPISQALFSPAAHGTFRPLSERGFFLLFGSLFSLNALPFHIWIFLTQFANLALMSSITRRVTGSIAAGFWAPLFWVANYNIARVMVWNSAYMQFLCAFFIFLAFHFLLRYIETGRRRDYVFQWLAFLAGFLAMEPTIVYPAIASLYALLLARKHFRSTLPLWAASLLYLALHMTLLPKQHSGPYAIHLDGSILHTFLKYWKLSLDPEFLEPLTHIRSSIGSTSMYLCTAALLAFIIWSARDRRWQPLFFLGWFVFLLAPLLPFRDHVLAYELTLPTTGLAMLCGAALATAWRGPIPVKLIATVLAAGFFLTSVPAASKTTAILSKRSRDFRQTMLGLAAAHRRDPDKAILVTGVSTDLFWGAIYGSVFGLVGIPEAYLAPGSDAGIKRHPELNADVATYVLNPLLVKSGMEQGRFLVYDVSTPEPVEITRTYQVPSALAQLPRRVDVGQQAMTPLLDSGWYKIESGSFRWTARVATLHMGGPESDQQRLHVSGYCAPEQVSDGPLQMTLMVDGRPLKPVTFTKGNAFDLTFDLPAGLTVKPSINITIELSHATRPEGDRELGLVFGVFEIR